jgi:hypothetical protein
VGGGAINESTLAAVFSSSHCFGAATSEQLDYRRYARPTPAIQNGKSFCFFFQKEALPSFKSPDCRQ